MATDPHLDSALERIAGTIRAELETVFQRQAAAVAERATAEREAAARQAAEAVRKETHRELEQARHAAQEQVDAARRSLQAEAAARARAEAQVEDVRRIGRTQVEDVQRTMGERLSAVARELDEARREAVERLDAAHGQAAASLGELVQGLHAVDEADSLTAVFQRMIDAARHHAKGAAVLIARGDELREWGSAGLERRAGDAAEVASNASRERRCVESESAIAFPVMVGGDVVAVLYAEVADALSPQRRISKDALDALTRHAGRVLEALTVQQASGLRPVRRESPAGGAGRSAGERMS